MQVDLTAWGMDVAWAGRPCRGEWVTGDASVIGQRDSLLFLAIVDGLGHGPSAHEVAVKAEDTLRETSRPDVLATMQLLHEALAGSLGAAAGLSVVDLSTGDVSHTGVGNTETRVLGSRDVRLYSTAGIVGSHMRSLQEHRSHLSAEDVLLMYTDGVSSRFELDDYPQMLYHTANQIAHAIVDRYGKEHDDATCIVLRHSR